MKKLLILMICIPLTGYSQYAITDSLENAQKGISFEHHLSWQQIKEKAKRENKYIFVDAYTTWCGPCRFMADSVFTQKRIGDAVNTKFIAIKVQMDTSKKDNPEVRKWYKDANAMMNIYKVEVFPTYLFFCPDGNIVHKDIGVKQPKEFIKVIASAIDSTKQYYKLLEKYENKKMNFVLMPPLANTANELGDKNLAVQIARDYLYNYLERLNESELCTRENLDFLGSFHQILSSHTKVFNLYYHYPEMVDSVMDSKGYARGFMDYIIAKEEIVPFIENAKKRSQVPDWQKITNNIKIKYGVEVAERNVVNEKVAWYRSKKDWKNYTHYLVKKVENSGIEGFTSSVMNIFFLNNSAWDVFQHSNNKEELVKALSWIDIAIPMDTQNPAGMIDTKANILYKLGRKEEAISVQKRAVSLEPNSEDMKATLEKMKQGKPTWPQYN